MENQQQCLHEDLCRSSNGIPMMLCRSLDGWIPRENFSQPVVCLHQLRGGGAKGAGLCVGVEGGSDVIIMFVSTFLCVLL